MTFAVLHVGKWINMRHKRKLIRAKIKLNAQPCVWQALGSEIMLISAPSIGQWTHSLSQSLNPVNILTLQNTKYEFMV